MSKNKYAAPWAHKVTSYLLKSYEPEGQPFKGKVTLLGFTEQELDLILDSWKASHFKNKFEDVGAQNKSELYYYIVKKIASAFDEKININFISDDHYYLTKSSLKFHKRAMESFIAGAMRVNHDIVFVYRKENGETVYRTAKVYSVAKDSFKALHIDAIRRYNFSNIEKLGKRSSRSFRKETLMQTCALEITLEDTGTSFVKGTITTITPTFEDFYKQRRG